MNHLQSNDSSFVSAQKSFPLSENPDAIISLNPIPIVAQDPEEDVYSSSSSGGSGGSHRDDFQGVRLGQVTRFTPDLPTNLLKQGM